MFLSPPYLQKDEVYLNLVLEYIPETVYKVARYYAKNKQTIPINFIRVSPAVLPVLALLVCVLIFRLFFFCVALHVPAVPESRVHPLARYLPS